MDSSSTLPHIVMRGTPAEGPQRRVGRAHQLRASFGGHGPPYDCCLDDRHLNSYDARSRYRNTSIRRFAFVRLSIFSAAY